MVIWAYAGKRVPARCWLRRTGPIRHAARVNPDGPAQVTYPCPGLPGIRWGRTTSRQRQGCRSVGSLPPTFIECPFQYVSNLGTTRFSSTGPFRPPAAADATSPAVSRRAGGRKNPLAFGLGDRFRARGGGVSRTMARRRCSSRRTFSGEAAARDRWRPRKFPAR